MGLKLATLAYVKDNGKTLMLHKAKGYQKGKWNGLGGKLDPGESPEECLKREVLEESGLLVEKAHLKGFLTWPAFDGVDDWYAFVYVVTAFSGDLLSATEEGELHWIDDDKVLELNVFDGDRVFIPWLSKDRLFSAKFSYEHGVFKDYEVVFYD